MSAARTGSDWQLSSAAPPFGRARALPAELKAGLRVALNSGPSIAEVVAEERERRTGLCQEIHRNEAESDHSRLVGDFVKLLTECLTLCQLLLCERQSELFFLAVSGVFFLQLSPAEKEASFFVLYEFTPLIFLTHQCTFSSFGIRMLSLARFVNRHGRTLLSALFFSSLHFFVDGFSRSSVFSFRAPGVLSFCTGAKTIKTSLLIA